MGQNAKKAFEDIKNELCACTAIYFTKRGSSYY